MQIMPRLPHNLWHPCLRLGILLPHLLVVMAISAPTSPESDLYALSKLKSSLLSGSAHSSPLFADWDIETSASGVVSSRTNHCTFSGITCDVSNRVVAINLTGVPLHGGVLPSEVSLLDALSSLTIAACSLSGVIPASLASMPLLRHLNLSINNISGLFPSPSTPSYFPSAKVIDVFYNNLTGPLPPFGMPHARMRHLDLGWNHFSGGVPEMYGDLNGLEFLGLDGNMLSGRVPPSLSRLRRMKVMYLGHHNSFDGGIPPEFGELSALIQLEMSNCNLTGPIPVELGRLSQLKLLYLFSNNLVGEIPTKLGSLKNLTSLDLSYNSFDGGIPQELGELEALVTLGMVHCNLQGPIPVELGHLTQIEGLFLYSNNLTGEIPAELGNLKNLMSLDLSYNQLTGEIPISFVSLTRLKLLMLKANELIGVIPEFVGELPQLEILHVWQNILTGGLPAHLGKNGRLLELDVTDNQLIGTIPAYLCAGRQLRSLILMRNKLSGPIPEDLGNCKTLAKVRLNKNFLSGSIPAGLFDLPMNAILDLSNNLLSGELPRVIPSAGLTFLLVALASNNLSGPLPPEIGHLKKLSMLNVRANALTAGIPRELSHCESLTVLDLSQNQLTGEIPKEITSLKVLSMLNLSRNRISGELPVELGEMIGLSKLDVSYNDLSGRIMLPQLQGVFAVSDKTDFEGNPSLCVEHITAASCPIPMLLQQSYRFKTRTLLWLVPTASAIVLTVCLGLRWRCTAQKETANRRRPTAWKMTRFENMDLEMDDVLGCLSEENAIGRGGAGTVYRCVTQGGMEVAVKRLPGPGRRDHGFRAEVTTLGGIRHRNVVRLLGFASSTEANLLLYEYMPKGSLGAVLHGDSGGLLLGWDDRLRVATEAARALCYLHHECSPRILHRDVKCNNILLDSAMEAHVADFGLAKFLSRGASCSGGTRAVAAEESVSVVAGTYGYIAPEYAYTRRVDEKTDVYSFGVVLLELVTGRRPLGDFGDEIDLVHWARSVVPRPMDTAAVLAVADPRLPPEPAGLIARLFRVGISCVRESCQARPTMREVVHVLCSFVVPPADPAC